MARSRMVEGTCRICGAFGPLSFEHVPPRAAFNDRPVVSYSGDLLLEHGLAFANAKGSIQQKGSGAYTLCPRCNNVTGSWYGNRFVEWCFQGMQILLRSGGRPTLVYLNYLFPLAILKQVITMFFSINNEHFHRVHPDLVRFVLDRERKYLPPEIRVHAYYTFGAMSRHVGVAGVINTESGATQVLSELSFPPFGYVMTFASPPPDPRLVDITHFARFDYGEFAVMNIQMPVLETHLALPGDYRTLAEIDRDVVASGDSAPSDA